MPVWLDSFCVSCFRARDGLELFGQLDHHFERREDLQTRDHLLREHRQRPAFGEIQRRQAKNVSLRSSCSCSGSQLV